MDSQSTFLSRIGQVFWEILGYVTSAVQRYLTPAPPNTGNDDTHISPEARVCEERNSDKEEEDNYLREETKRDSKCWSHVDTADERVVNLMQREILLSNQQEANDGQDKADITQDKMKLAVEVEDTYIFANEQENKKQDDKTTEDESHKSVDQRTEKKIESVEEAAFRLPGDEYPFREEDESKWERKKERKNARKYEDLIQSNEVNIFRGHTEERDVTEKVKGESGVKEVVMIREDMMGRSNGKTEAVAGETPFGVDEFLLSDTIDTLEIEPADGVEAGSTGQGSNEENERCTEESMGIVSITKTSMGVLERGSKGEEMRGKWQGVQKSQRLEKKTNSHKKELAGADERDMSYLYELGEEDRKEDESTVGKNGEECARIQPVQKEKVDNRKKEEKSYEEKQEAKIEGECGSGIYEIFETASKEVDVSMENRESDKVGQEEEKREVEQNETAEMGVQERLQVMETEIILETVMAGEGRDESRKTQMAGQDEVQRVEEYADVNKNVTQRNEESKDGEISPESVLTLNMGQYKRTKERVEEEGDVNKLRDELDEEDKSQGSITEDRDESNVTEESGGNGGRERCVFELEKEGNNIYEGMRDIKILHEERWREKSKINEEVAASWVDVGESVAANEKLAKENKVTSGTEWKDEGEVDKEKEREREERSPKEEPTGVEVSMEDGELDKVKEEEENRGAELKEWVETEVQKREKEKVEEEGDVDKLRDELDEEDISQGSVTEERDESDVIEEGGEDGERERCLSESEKEGNDASVGMRDIEILQKERWRKESKINEEVAASWVDVGESVAANEKLAKENKVTSGTEWKDEGEVDKEKEREREERSHKEEPTGVEASMEDGELDKVEEEEENRGAELNERVETEVQEREKEKVEEEGDVDKLRDELDEEDKSQGSVTEERDKSDVIEGGGEYGERERCLSESEKEKNDASVGMRDIEILLEERWREESKINEEVAASWVDVGESMEAKKIVAEITKEISRTEWMDDINYEGEEYKERRREERPSIEESAGAEVSMKDGKSDQLREEKDNRGAKKNEVVEVEVQEKLLLKEPEIKHETIMAGGEEEMRKTQVAGQDEVQREEESAEMEKNATQRYEKSNDQVTLPEGVFTLNMGQFETEKDRIEEEGDMNKLRDELDEEKNQGSVTENIEESDVIEDGGEDGERERCLSLHEERWREESKINEEVAASWVDVGESKACEVNVQNIREEKNLEISVTELRDDRKHRENVYKVKEQEILHISTEEQPYENINIFHEALDMSKTNETKTDLQQTEEPRTHENIFGRNSQVIDLFKVAEQKETKKEERDNECLEKQRTILKVGETKDEGHLSDENVDIKTMEEGDGMDLNVAPACKSELIEGFSANVETVGITLRDGWAIEETEETRNNDGNQNGDTLYAVDRGLIRGAERRRNINECTRSTTEGQRPKIQLKIEKGVKLEEDENFTNVKEIQSQFGDAKLHKTSEHGKLFAEITGQCRTRIVNKETDGNEGRKQITKDGVGKKRIQKRTHENEEVFNLQLDSPSLDFTAQKFRIALKNRHTRAPKDPRILLHISSLSPTSAPPKLDEETATKPVGIKVGGAGMMGFKLPGIGAGFPVLKKTEGRVEEKGEEGSGQMIMKAPTPNLGPDDREPAATKKWAAGSVGVMLPGLGPGMPALRKTDKGVKLIEKTTDDATVSHGKRDTSSGGGAERNREESKEKGVKGVGPSTIKLPSFGAGFPVLRKTGMGNKLRGEEGKTSEAEQNETENNQPEKPGSDSPMLVSELKKRFMKTERK